MRPGSSARKETTDFGAQHKGIARLATKEVSQAMLRKSVTIERSGVEVSYASGPSRLHGCVGPVFGDEFGEISERRAAKSECRYFDAGRPDFADGNCWSWPITSPVARRSCNVEQPAGRPANGAPADVDESNRLAEGVNGSWIDVERDVNAGLSKANRHRKILVA